MRGHYAKRYFKDDPTLTGYWPMNMGLDKGVALFAPGPSGVPDSGNPMLPIGGPAYSSKLFGTGFDLSHSDDNYLAEANAFDSLWDGMVDFTIMVWICTSSRPTGIDPALYHCPFMITTGGQGAGTFDKGFRITSDGSVHFYTYNPGFQGTSNIHSFNVTDGKPHLLVGQFETGVGIKMYVDGKYEGIDAAATTTYNHAQPEPVWRYRSSNTSYKILDTDSYNGAVGETCIIERVLSIAEISGYINFTKRRCKGRMMRSLWWPNEMAA